jgi:hypothetical protein
MKVTLRASTGAKILVWREEDVLHSRRLDFADRAQVCLGVDLFEVIAELAELDLEQGAQAAEAMALAEKAQRQLGMVVGPAPGTQDGQSARPDDGTG